MNSSLDLSILIVNWNTAPFLRRCLRSIYRETQGVSFEVIVVDNASLDGSAEVVSNEFPQVRFIQSDQNLGFARANNLAFQHSQGNVLLLLNPDTEIVGDAISAMLSALAGLSGAGIVGAKLLNTDRSIQTPCIKRFPTISGEMLSIEWLRRKWPRCRLWSIDPLFSDPQEPVRVDAVSGACQMIRRAVYQEVGGLSNKYFMYAEDIEVSATALARGWKTYYVGNATVIHHGAKSSIGRNRGQRWISIMQREAMWRYFRTWRGLGHATSYRAMIGLMSVPRLLGISLLLPALAIRGQGNRAAGALLKWLGALQWSIGLQGITKTFHAEMPHLPIPDTASKEVLGPTVMNSSSRTSDCR